MNINRPVSILLMTQSDENANTIQSTLNAYSMVFLKSNPSYANYLKILQYLPDAIVMEIPQTFHNQLHFVQLIKQNRLAGNIPIICFGNKLPSDTISGMYKIGISTYLNRPFNNKTLMDEIIRQLNNRGISPNKKQNITAKEKQFDIEQILSPHIPSRLKIELMAKYITETRAFPFTVSMALKLLNSETSSAADIAKIISTDPTLSASFLKRTNSAFFAGNNVRSISMKEAVVRIGFTETRRLLTGMPVMKVFDTQKVTPGFNRIKFWTHCLATAKIAEQIALLTRQVDPDEAFLAGIMHDFGIILFDEFFPELFSRVLQVTTDSGIRFYEAEKKILTVTHNDLVHHMFCQWEMPERIINAVVNHYTAFQPLSIKNDSDDILTLIIAMANILAKTFSLGASCDQFITQIDNKVFSSLQLTPGLPDDFYQEIVKSLQTYKRLLEIDENDILPVTEMTVSCENGVIGSVNLAKALYNPIEHYLRLNEYSIDTISPPIQPAHYHNKFDTILIFADNATMLQDVKPFTQIRKKGNSANTLQNRDSSFAPVIIISHTLPPSLENTASLSFYHLPEAIDLRMLDMYIASIICGKGIQTLPGEYFHKSIKGNYNKKNTWYLKLQTISDTLQKIKEQCSRNTIVSADHARAEKLITEADIRQTENNYETACTLMTLAVEYYQRSLLLFKLSQCEKSINNKETYLGRISTRKIAHHE